MNSKRSSAGSRAMFGGRGFTETSRVARHLRDVRVCRIYEGTDPLRGRRSAEAVPPT